MGSKECCIYKVPSQLREVKPAAYTPRILLIGPLHHFAKPKVFERDIEANSLMEDLKNGNPRYINVYPWAMAVLFLFLDIVLCL